MRWWPAFLCAAVAACSSSSGPGPGATDAGDAAADGKETGPVCGVAPCGTANDCQAARGGLPGCWQCVAGCCSAVPTGTDPAAACTTACKVAKCDGAGGCGPAVSTTAKGSPCGSVCYTNTSNQQLVLSAECDGSGVCTQYSGGTFDNCYAGSLVLCAGNSNNCSACPASGCVAHCADLDASAPSCP